MEIAREGRQGKDQPSTLGPRLAVRVVAATIKGLGGLNAWRRGSGPTESLMSIMRENSHPQSVRRLLPPHPPRAFPTKRRYAAGQTVCSLAPVAPQFESLSISWRGVYYMYSRVRAPAPSLCEHLRPWLALRLTQLDLQGRTRHWPSGRSLSLSLALTSRVPRGAPVCDRHQSATQPSFGSSGSSSLTGRPLLQPSG